MQQRWKAWVLLGTFSFFGACTSCLETSSCETRECETDDDCGAGEKCLDDTLGTECARPCTCDSECEVGAYCGVPIVTASEALRCTQGCRDDDDCAATEVCDLHFCREGCRTHEDCPPDQACVAGFRCGQGCRTDEECSPGEICDGSCREGCRDDGECTDGTVCVQQGRGHGVCAAGCASDGDCAAPERCLCGRCVEHCEIDDDCDEGLVCPVVVDACELATCTEPDLGCGAEICSPLASPTGWWGELKPCCIPGVEPRCGYEPAELFSVGHCGALIDPLVEATCPCPEDGCCLPDGSCGVVFHGTEPFTLCIPVPEAADPSCVPG